MRKLPDQYTGSDANADMIASGAVDNPLPRSSEVQYSDNPLLWKAGVFDSDAEFKDVKVSDVKTMQDYLIAPRVAEYMLPDEERPEDTKKLSAVIRVGDEIVCINGTHRLAAYWLQEKTEIRVMDLGRWSKSGGKWEKKGHAMGKRTKVELPPEPGESRDDYLERCMDEEGFDEDTCLEMWEERSLKAMNRVDKVHVTEGSNFDFVLSDENPDRMGDIVTVDGWDLKNFKRNPVALFNHDKNSPIGVWKSIKVDGKQLKATLEFAAPGTSPRIDEIRALVEQNILRATSVGFLPHKMEPIESKDKDRFFPPVKYLKQELLEASLVAVPANSNALRLMKSLGISEATQRIVLRDLGTGTQPEAAAGAKKVIVVKTQEAKMAKRSIAEQIAGFEATRAAKNARMLEIMEQSAEKGETLNAEQQDEYDGLGNEMKSIDDHLGRLRLLEKSNLSKAIEVKGDDTVAALRSRAGNGNGSDPVVRVTTRRQVPPGILFARHFIARMFAQLNHCSPVDAARNFGYFDQTPELEEILKAPVNPGNTTDVAWAKPLVEPTFMAQEFIELLKPATIIGRIPGLRRVPFNIKIPREITAATVNWVGEGKPKPVSAMAFDSISLGFTKVAGIVPVTEELFRFSNPAIETLVRDSLITAVALLTDRDFLDPSKAAVAGVSPASVTNGVTPIPASGTTADNLRSDLGRLMETYVGTNMGLTGLVLVMTSVQAVRIGLMRNPLGATEFPGLNPAGGNLEGIPVVTSENIVHTGGSPGSASIIVAINAPEVLLADDGAVSVDMSREASLQMESAPVDPTATTIMVSLWQQNMVALRAERMINWMKRRAGAVQYISNADYA